MPSNEEIAGFLNDRLEQRLDRVRAVTTPIYIDHRRKFEHIGSGVLLSVGDVRFALTAAHVTDYLREGRLCIGGESMPIPLVGTVRATIPPAGGREQDKVDVAVVHLADVTAKHLKEHEFLRLDELDDRTVCRHDDFFLVAGYPCTKQKFVARTQTIEAYIYPFVAVSKKQADYDAQGYDPAINVLLGFHQRDMWRRDVGRLTAPQLYGMSGGGVWWLEGYTGLNSPLPRLFAIAIEWHADSHRQILGTRVAVALSAIWRDFPSLRVELP